MLFRSKTIPTNIKGQRFEIGTFGSGNIARKMTQKDRFPVNQLPETINKSFLAVRASDNPKSLRYGNIAILSKDGKGLRVVYVRPNKAGALEVINAHKIPEANMAKYFKDLGFSSISDQIRTGKMSLEDSQFIRLAYGDKLSL